MAFIFLHGIPTGFHVFESKDEVENAIGWDVDHHYDCRCTFRTVEGEELTLDANAVTVVVSDRLTKR